MGLSPSRSSRAKRSEVEGRSPYPVRPECSRGTWLTLFPPFVPSAVEGRFVTLDTRPWTLCLQSRFQLCDLTPLGADAEGARTEWLTK